MVGSGNFTSTLVPSTSAAPPTTNLPTTTTSLGSSSSDDATTVTSNTIPTTTEKPVTKTIITDGGATTLTITSTSSRSPPTTSSDPTTALSSSPLSSSTPSPTSTGTAGNSGGLHGTSKVVVAVVVPLIGVALIALLAVFFWRKRNQGRANEDARRKEVEEYGYNPNSDMTGGTGSGGAGSSNGEEMIENDGEGYRGWGSTNGGRKSSNLASSTGTAVPLSPGGIGFSDGGYSHDGGYAHGGGNGNGLPISPSASTFPTGTATSTDGDNSNAPLIHRPESGASVIGAMTGPLASSNNGGIHRGPSNASSNYSAMSHSDGSDGGMPPTQYDAQYYGADGYENYSGPPYQQYGDNGGHQPPPLIRDVSARRNTRIETPTNQHFPQQGNSGIAQNF